MQYARNGVLLGTAFTNLRRGPGMAYFPAASLEGSQSCEFNFGGAPFTYPVAGYAPFQAAPSSAAIARTTYLLDCQRRLLQYTDPVQVCVVGCLVQLVLFVMLVTLDGGLVGWSVCFPHRNLHWLPCSSVRVCVSLAM